jgi:hypothetical protein
MVDMFNDIRANGACKFQIPVPKTGQPDYGMVNVYYTPLGQTDQQVVNYVGDVSKCDAQKGGWYYDVDPSSATPTRILLCPASCSGVKLSTQGVTVLLGCKTVVC